MELFSRVAQVVPGALEAFLETAIIWVEVCRISYAAHTGVLFRTPSTGVGRVRFSFRGGATKTQTGCDHLGESGRSAGRRKG